MIRLMEEEVGGKGEDIPRGTGPWETWDRFFLSRSLLDGTVSRGMSRSGRAGTSIQQLSAAGNGGPGNARENVLVMFLVPLFRIDTVASAVRRGGRE